MSWRYRVTAGAAWTILLGTSAAAAGSAPPPQRLAATLTTPAGGQALLATGDTQEWLGPGDRIGDCQLLRVEISYADLRCGGHWLHLPLDASGAGHPPRLPQSERIELPAGALEALVARPQALALGLDLVPELEHGTLRGWRIRHLDPANPLYRFGFREADLVVAVGGFTASEPEALVAGLRTLPRQGAFSVQLLRAERPFELLLTAPPALLER